MSLMDNVNVAESIGQACFVCDKPIRGGETILEVSFQLIMRVRKEVHVGCAEKLCVLLKRKVEEAKR